MTYKAIVSFSTNPFPTLSTNGKFLIYANKARSVRKDFVCKII